MREVKNMINDVGKKINSAVVGLLIRSKNQSIDIKAIKLYNE
jgi:hypothetical protein